MPGKQKSGANPLYKFCRRFVSVIALIIGIALLCVTILYTSETVESFFFKQSSIAVPLLYCMLWSSLLLCTSSLLAVTTVPTSNVSVMTTVTFIGNSGLLISEVVKYVNKYDTSQPELEIDGFLTTWLTGVFLATFFSILESALTIASHKKLVSATVEAILETKRTKQIPIPPPKESITPQYASIRSIRQLGTLSSHYNVGSDMADHTSYM